MTPIFLRLKLKIIICSWFWGPKEGCYILICDALDFFGGQFGWQVVIGVRLE